MNAPDVVLASGHMIDDPSRKRPRFPPDQEARVTASIARALDEWTVGASTTIICGGARGADLIVAEQARDRGARVVLCLAEPRADFVERSVALPGTDWEARFENMCQYADVRILSAERSAGGSIHAATNTWMIELAVQLATHDDDPRAIVVWDGGIGDGAGGTRDFVRQLGITDLSDERLIAVDPTPRQYEPR